MLARTMDGKQIEIQAERIETAEGFCLSISRDTDFSSIQEVALDGLGAIAEAADPGYLTLPRGVGNVDYSLFFFQRHQEDFTAEITESNMPVFGVHSEKGTYLAVVSGMSYDYALRVSRENGRYRCYPVFQLFGEQPYEDLRVEYFRLTGEDANYSGMARRYRRYQIARTGMRPLQERAQENPCLDYAKDAVMIRVRCGWKPAPAAVLHQTRENEPPMHVACDFQRVGEILDELKRQGVDKAEICLVGWNVKGHDGRWPETFPVCEELGGEAALRALIQKAQAMGYSIICHTNSTDQYEIADCYSPENTRRDRTGKPVVNDTSWSGGEMYQLCPQVGYEQAEKILPQVAALGFRGVHYVDVLGVVHPRRCYHPAHPVHSGQAVEYAKKLGALCRSLFGGFSSEGAYDFLAPYLDFGLYISFGRNQGLLCDRSIPFWEIVYHGYTLYNPYTETVNPAFKPREQQLRAIEFGGRPTYYFYAKFTNNGYNWMGVQEPRADSPEELRESVCKIKEDYQQYRKLDSLHTAFMEKHEQVGEGIFETTYSNGTVVRVDYGKETVSVR